VFEDFPQGVRARSFLKGLESCEKSSGRIGLQSCRRASEKVVPLRLKERRRLRATSSVEEHSSFRGLIRKKRTDEILRGDFAKFRGSLDLAGARKATVQERKKVRSSEGQEPSIGITRSVDSTRRSAYREFVRETPRFTQRSRESARCDIPTAT
jgi:hypothetical protein